MAKKKLPQIKVQKQAPTDDGWQFTVWIGEEEEKSEHIVALDREYWQKLTKGVGAPADLIRKSFEFLLACETQGAILNSFDLRDIKKYFPEFEREIMPDEPYIEAREKKS